MTLSMMTLDAIPGPVTTVTLMKTCGESHALTCDWEKPPCHGAELVNYEVQCQETSDGPWQRLDEGARG